MEHDGFIYRWRKKKEGEVGVRLYSASIHFSVGERKGEQNAVEAINSALPAPGSRIHKCQVVFDSISWKACE